MKKLLILCFLFCLSLSAMAQKNVFNVPVPEPVEQGILYVQPGINITDENLKLNNILTYGLGNGFQAGLNINDLTIDYNSEDNVFPYDSVAPGENPDVLAHLQKGFDLSEKLKLGIGTWSGANIANEIDFSSFSYVNFSANILGNNKLILGGYYGNDTYVVQGNNTGLMAGVEVPLIQDKLKLLGDYISGKNERSVINLGFEVQLPKNWQLAIGAQLPAPNSGNQHGLVIQLNN